MKYILILFLSLITINLYGQLNLLNITPSDGSTNVPLNITITVEFDQPIDTLKGFNFFEDFFTNVYDLQAIWYSSDLKTVNLGGNLEADKNYYFLVNSALTPTGEKLSNPTVVYFTTASELTGSTVTGTVYASENSGIDLNNTFVALSSTPLEDGEPMIEVGAFANSNGVFLIPNVYNGDYYPIAGNDSNEDGKLDPTGGDAFSFLDLISIDGDFAGLNFSLSVLDPMTLMSAFEEVDTLIQNLLNESAQLKRIGTWNTDLLGNAGEWEFYFITDSVNKVSRLRIDRFGYKLENRYDDWEYQSLVNMDLIPSISNSVDLKIFMENAEAAGGYAFRNQDKPANLEFNLELMLADHRYSHLSYLNPDTTQPVMWAAIYKWYEQVGEDDWQTESELVFFGEYQTGSLVVTDINNADLEVPTSFSLGQNYPNPFNPLTIINYSIPVTAYGNSSSIQIKVYDVLGNELATLVDEYQKPGNYTLNFDASSYPSGTYFYQLKTDSYTNTKKMLLLK